MNNFSIVYDSGLKNNIIHMTPPCTMMEIQQFFMQYLKLSLLMKLLFCEIFVCPDETTKICDHNVVTPLAINCDCSFSSF